jgi:RNA polymerase sigma factor (sigma-70 family)
MHDHRRPTFPVCVAERRSPFRRMRRRATVAADGRAHPLRRIDRWLSHARWRMTPRGLDELVVKAQGGDRDAFRELVLATQRELAISVAAHSVSRELVEEVLQETYVTAFEKLAQYRPEGTFRPWLRTIARNHLFAHWRERRRLAELDADALDALIADDGLDGLAHDDGVHEEESARLAACLELLPERARTMLERRYCEEQPLALLARQFKRSAATLSVTLFRLRQQLRRCVERSA